MNRPQTTKKTRPHLPCHPARRGPRVLQGRRGPLGIPFPRGAAGVRGTRARWPWNGTRAGWMSFTHVVVHLVVQCHGNEGTF